MVNEDIHEIISFINEIEILKFIFVWWMPKTLNYQCNFFYFYFSIFTINFKWTNDVWPHIVFFIKNYNELLFFINKNTCLSQKIHPFGKFKKLMIILIYFGSFREAKCVTTFVGSLVNFFLKKLANFQMANC